MSNQDKLKSLSLDEIDSGVKVKVKDYSQLSCRSVLLGIGVLPEDEIEVIKASFLGSPIYFKNQQGLFFALRKLEAKKVIVELS